MPSSKYATRGLSIFVLKEHQVIMQVLRKRITTFSGVLRKFGDNFVCNSKSEDCMWGKWKECPNFFQQVRANVIFVDPAETEVAVGRVKSRSGDKIQERKH